MKLEISGEFKKPTDHAGLVAAVSNGMQIGLAKTASYIQTNKLSGQVLHHRTGNLKRSVMSSVEVESSGEEVIGKIGGKIYGLYNELGAEIYPKRAKMLRFTKNGKVIYAKHVHLPARPWLKPGLEECRELLFKAIVSKLREAAHAS